MRIFDKKRLHRLLSRSGDLAFAGDHVGMTNYVVTSPIIGHELLDAYTRRFETAGDDYEGFSKLLNALSTLTNKKIKVHSFELNGKQIFLFTDSDIKKIHGMLVKNN